MFTLLRYLLDGLHKMPYTMIVLLLGTMVVLYWFLRSRRNQANELMKFWTIEPTKPHAQWVMICGNDKRFTIPYLEGLALGKLKILQVVLSEETDQDLPRCDHKISLANIEEIDKFMSYRHFKILVNTAPLWEGDKAEHTTVQTTMMKLCERVFNNMKQHGMGTMVTVYSADKEREVFGKAFASQSNELMKKLGEPQPPIFVHEVILPSESKNAAGFARRALGSFGSSAVIA